MLPKQLAQIRRMLELKDENIILNDNEKEMLNELNWMNRNTELQRLIQSHITADNLVDEVEVLPDRCPGCGRRF
jgi:hypothetical protein